MTLFQYIIRILMSNSDTVFAALVMSVFGYIGWLLWKLNNNFKDFLDIWEKHQENLESIRTKMEKIDEEVHKKLINQVDSNTRELDKLLLVLNDSNNEIERMRSEIIAELKESSNELKDIIMIILNKRDRSIREKEAEGVQEDKGTMDTIESIETEWNKDLLPEASKTALQRDKGQKIETNYQEVLLIDEKEEENR
ncbi:MAG: hypothetical protein ACHQYO_04465 [Halanaerobiales bacterium]